MIAINIKGDLSFGVPPEPMSKACADFYLEHVRLFTFLRFVQETSCGNDLDKLIAKKALNDTAEPEEQKRYTSLVSHNLDTIRQFFSHQPLLLEMLYCRYIDTYLNYITGFLTTVFIHRPDTLRSNDTITVSEVLEYRNFDELIRYIADKRVHQLSYKGFFDLTKYVSEKLGFELISQKDDFNRLRVIIEIRNLITHNRGIVNEIFLSRTSEVTWKYGDKITLSTDEVISVIALLTRLVRDIEIRGAKKFNYKQEVISKEEVVYNYLKLTQIV